VEEQRRPGCPVPVEGKLLANYGGHRLRGGTAVTDRRYKGINL